MRKQSPLRTRNYRLYFSGQLISVPGTWLQTVAQAWLVLQLSSSGSALGVTVALQTVPVLVLPHFNEQYLAGLRLQQYGAGLVVPGKASTAEYAGLLDRLLSQPAFKQQAVAFAQRYAGHHRDTTGRAVFALLEGMLQRAG